MMAYLFLRISIQFIVILRYKPTWYMCYLLTYQAFP